MKEAKEREKIAALSFTGCIHLTDHAFSDTNLLKIFKHVKKVCFNCDEINSNAMVGNTFLIMFMNGYLFFSKFMTIIKAFSFVYYVVIEKLANIEYHSYSITT